jgi:hypothetical protein
MHSKHKLHSPLSEQQDWNEDFDRAGYRCLAEYHLFRSPRHTGLELTEPQKTEKIS